MVRIARSLVVLAAVVIAPLGVASGAEKAGVRMADTLEVGGKSLTLNGLGLREATFLKVDVYVAGLYLERVSSDPQQILGSNQIKVLALHFVRDVDRGDILEAWHDGFARNATVPVAQIRSQTEQLDAWMPRFRKGDTLLFTYVPGTGVYVDINGQRKGLLPGEDFARSLFAIWLGPKPPGSALKRGLLGRH